MAKKGKNKDKCKRYEQEERKDKNHKLRMARVAKRLAYFAKRRELKDGIDNDAKTPSCSSSQSY